MNSAIASPEDGALTQSKASRSIALIKHPAILGLILAAATVGLYYPVHGHPFTNYDDNDYVFENRHVQSGLTFANVRWAFTTGYASNWHPLTWISHQLDSQFFGANPYGPHDVNLLLHALNAVLLFWVLWRATGFVGRSFVVAALFALHPINVESVAWIAERKTVLSTMFFLLALGAYRWYAHRPRLLPYAVVTFLFALGLMCKPQIITFPFVLLLWDYWPLQRMFAPTGQASNGTATTAAIPPRSFRWLIKEKIPLFFGCLISAGITMKAQHVVRPKEWAYTASVRIENAIVAYARYVREAFWPSRLSPLYPHPGNTLKAWQVIAASLFLLTVTALVLAGWRRRYLLVGWLWFLGTLVPMIGLIQVGRQAMADRYAYISLMGLFILVCWGVADWARQKHLPSAVLPTVSLAVLMALAVVARRQINYWSDNLLLWQHALQVTESNWAAEGLVGQILVGSGRDSEAMPHLYSATKIAPMNWMANIGIGIYSQKHGNLPEAIAHYQKVVSPLSEAKPEVRMKAYERMAAAYRDLGDPAQAEKCSQLAQEQRQKAERR